MQTWLIEPRDPLIVRDGRPFSADIAGARATSLDFPFPSTTTGGVRTSQGRGKGGNFDAALIEELKKLEVRGPLLVELDDRGEIAGWLMPAPADALWRNLKPDSDDRIPTDRAMLTQLTPVQLPDGAFTNLPDGDLCPIGTSRVSGKPFEMNSFRAEIKAELRAESGARRAEIAVVRAETHALNEKADRIDQIFQRLYQPVLPGKAD